MAIIEIIIILLTSYLEIFHWNEMLNWWLPGCIYWSYIVLDYTLNTKQSGKYDVTLGPKIRSSQKVCQKYNILSNIISAALLEMF